MHIPDAQRAIDELVRIAKPGGYLVLEEINQNAPEARMMRLLWSTLKKKKITITRTPAGPEHTCARRRDPLLATCQPTLVDRSVR